MNKRITLLFGFLLITSITLFAGKVTIEKARMIAMNAYYEKASAHYDVNYQTLEFSSEHIIKYNDVVSYYVFNVTGNKGYIIIAADDHVYPVLGYAYEGAYNLTDQSPAQIDWMETYSKQIQHVRETNAASTPEIDEAWIKYTSQVERSKSNSSKDVGPLLKTKWGQDEYYNTLCPASSGPGGHCVTGCVATAMAQVMKYHAHPKHGTGSHSYTHPSYGLQTADFGSTNYNFGNMPNNQVTSPNNDVATLMYHCGVSVEMNYGPYGSGANTGMSVSAFMTYFGYSYTAYEASKDNYTDIKFKILLRADLINRRPVLYRGQGSGGHAFVCDGFEYPDHFHFNWGWDGSGDGYFYLTSLNPSGGNYTYNQAGMLNVFPDPQYTNPSGISEFDKAVLTVYPNPASDFVNISLKGSAAEKAIVKVLDITGRLVVNNEIDLNAAETVHIMDVSNLKKGVYLIEVSGQDISFEKKLVIQ